MDMGNRAALAAMAVLEQAGEGDATPGKELVRRWLAERAVNRQPLPEPDAIRRAVGWPVAAAPATKTPEAA